MKPITAPSADRDAAAVDSGPAGSATPLSYGTPGFSRRDALAAGFVIGALLLVLLAGNMWADLDMFHEMALIRESLAAGHLVQNDVHAYTPTVPRVVHHEWATGAVLYFLVVGLGLGGAGVVALRLMLFAGIAACCWRVARRLGAPGVLLAWLAPVGVTMMATGVSPVRAHLFTFAALGCLLVLLSLDRRGMRWWLAAWLPVYVTWLNLHGGFVVGAGLFALHTAERTVLVWLRHRDVRTTLRATAHLWLGGVATVILTVVNPYGWAYVPYLWQALGLDRPHIAEWAPLWDARSPWEAALLHVTASLLLLYALIRAGTRTYLHGLPLVLAGAWFAATSVRLMPVYAILWIIHVPAWLAGTDLHRMIDSFSRRFKRPLVVAAVLFGVLAVGKAVQLRFWQLVLPTDPELLLHYPEGPTEYLAEIGFSGRLMTPFNYGAFVSWRLHPAVLVGMDSRYEVAYPPSALDDNVALYEGAAGWEARVTQHGTDAVLVPRSAVLDTLLLRQGAWPRVYVDDAFSIYVRPERAAELPPRDRTGEEITGRFP